MEWATRRDGKYGVTHTKRKRAQNLGPGFLESVYEKALCVELAERGPQSSIIRLICVHSRSFAAKKKISSKPNGGNNLPYGSFQKSRTQRIFLVSPLDGGS